MNKKKEKKLQSHLGFKVEKAGVGWGSEEEFAVYMEVAGGGVEGC